MEILYQIDNIDKLKKFYLQEESTIKWLNLQKDLYSVYLFSKDRKPDIIFDEKELFETFQKWSANGCIYCAIFADERIVGMAAVEKYSEDKWETADVRVIRSERNKGYAKQICYFVTKFILDSGHIATCRTEEDNIPMQKVIHALGFIPCK
jgi:RimJ/RimL family protein N-acetyltransferase